MNLRSIAAAILFLPAAVAAQDSPRPQPPAPSAVAPAPAVDDDATAAIHSFIAGINDPARLREVETQYAALTTNDATVAAGLAALRLWEVTADVQHARRSRRYFDRAADRDSRNAWAHYGHALSLQAEMGGEPGFFKMHVNAARDLGLDPVSRARRALERAVALDPTLPGALDLLARYAAATNDRDALSQARTAFEGSFADSAAGINAMLGAAMTARELGDFVGAASAARRAIDANPTSAEAHLELTIALANIEDSLPAAARAYTETVRLADDAMLERLWKDASVLQSSREAAAWRFADASERRGKLDTFWAVRGVLGGFSGAERAAEHYRRVTIANERFARHGGYGAAPLNALNWERTNSDYDDRGVIFIKHGDPIATYGEPPLQSYVAWFYEDEQGEVLSYHFFKSGEAGHAKDYVLMRDLPCPAESDVVRLDPRIAPLLWRCDPLNVRSVSAEIGRDATRALGTDSHHQPFIEAVPFHYDWYTFRGDSGTEVLMTVGVPLDQLPAGERSLRVSLAVVDTLWSSIAQHSVVTEPVTGSSETGLILRTHVSLIAEPTGRDVYRIGVRDAADPRIGTVYGGDITVPDYRGQRLLMSDIVLAEQRDGNFMRGGHRLALAPTHIFREGEFRVYYELYNMPGGATYDTELTVEPLGGGGVLARVRRLFGGRNGVQLRFQDIAPDDGTTVAPQVRDVTAPFGPGAYLMRITIRTASGTVTRERRFMIE